MRLTYISSSTIPSRAANSIHVMKMCQALAKNGHQVVLLAPDKKASYQPEVVDVFDYYGVKRCFEIVRLPWLRVPGKSYYYGLAAAITAKRTRPDLVYCRNLVGCFWSAIIGLPVVLESHDSLEKSNKINEWMFRRLIKSAMLQKLVVITHRLKEYYEITYPQAAAKIQVAPDGADPVRVDTPAAEIKKSVGRLQVGYVGHLYKGRGVEVVVALAENCRWADFHLVGGDDRDINDWKSKVNGQENIHFHGFVPPAEAERFRIAFDVLLAPYQSAVSVSGGGGDTVRWMSPLKIFEYMAAGRAIVSSDLPVLGEVLENGRNALLCPSDDLAAWKSALEQLRSDIGLRERLGRVALEDFVGQYTWEARAMNLVGRGR